jgi:hypothetical protein
MTRFDPLQLAACSCFLAAATLAAANPPAPPKPPPAKPKPPPAKAKPPANKKGPNPAAQKLRTEEARALLEVYVLLASGNHDYDGHRVLAMKQVGHAIRALDPKGGSPAIDQVNAAAAAAPVVHENQAVSDAALAKGAEGLAELRTVFVKNKQHKIVGHVDNAVKEIHTALKIR